MTPAKATSAPARWSLRFTASDIERFIPATGALLVGFDERRPVGRQLFEIQAFATREEAEAAMVSVADTASFISFAKPRSRPKQLALFADPTSTNMPIPGSRARRR